MAHDVFISYASEDKPIADACCARLEQAGIRCWIAPRDIISGTDWSASIIDAIAGSRTMVLVFSEYSNVSGQVKREVERAASRGLAILPFRIRDAPLSKHMEYFISTPHWLDALTPPLEKHLEHLVGTVRLVLTQTTEIPHEPLVIPRRPAGAMTEPRPEPSVISSRAARTTTRNVTIVAVAIVVLLLGIFALTGRVGRGSGQAPSVAEPEPPTIPVDTAVREQLTEEKARTPEPSGKPTGQSSEPVLEPPGQESPKPDRSPDGPVAEKAPELVKRYLQAISSGDADTVVSLYDDNAEYYGLGRVGRETIRSDKAAYFRAWPSVRFELLEIERAVATGDSLEATFRIHFAVENPRKGRRISGTARNVVTWRLEDDGSARIVSDQQKVLSREHV
jgi:ketosteroid isomerase-like protein